MPPAAQPTEFAERVLALVETIPPGKVMTYGDVAEFLDSAGARAVGHVMATRGHEVPWWRVIRASGHPTSSSPAEALRRLQADRTPLLPGGERVDLRAARWDGRQGDVVAP